MSRGATLLATRTVQADWLDYVHDLHLENAPEPALTELRRAFFGGAFGTVMAIGLALKHPSIEPHEAAHFIDDRGQECMNFLAQVLDGAA